MTNITFEDVVLEYDKRLRCIDKILDINSYLDSLIALSGAYLTLKTNNVLDDERKRLLVENMMFGIIEDLLESLKTMEQCDMPTADLDSIVTDIGLLDYDRMAEISLGIKAYFSKALSSQTESLKNDALLYLEKYLKEPEKHIEEKPIPKRPEDLLPFDLNIVRDTAVENNQTYLVPTILELNDRTSAPYKIRRIIEESGKEGLTLKELKDRFKSLGYTSESPIYSTIYILKNYLAYVVTEGKGDKKIVRLSTEEDFELGGYFY